MTKYDTEHERAGEIVEKWIEKYHGRRSRVLGDRLRLVYRPTADEQADLASMIDEALDEVYVMAHQDGVQAAAKK